MMTKKNSLLIKYGFRLLAKKKLSKEELYLILNNLRKKSVAEIEKIIEGMKNVSKQN
jgi:hypothetical protein